MAAVPPLVSMAAGWRGAGALRRGLPPSRCWQRVRLPAPPLLTRGNPAGRSSRGLSSSSSAMAPLKVGDKLPNVEVYEGDPGTKVNVASLFKGKKGILFGVPGAFTPGCSKTHLPGYVEKAGQLKGKGVEIIACLAVNDVFVMSEWGKAYHAEGKVRMLADPTGEFGKATDLLLDKEPLRQLFGGNRSKRFSMVVQDGVVASLNVEEDGTGLTCSLANNIVSQL
ncbi:peroxiredoxin-5, mitochondrial [Hemicordylus capensis]|uniref:peroxiredoxin-5, mitochondrial n=1 Tax=Hemicordylus capensis TaxID=884348 RepID=UPI0023033A53|nr:peroxiredoxin-5, mitochondrial [Hemicordylus capensis]